MTDITGIIRDSEQNALAGAIVTLRPSKAVVGYDGGAIARRTHVFTADGSGSVTMTDIAPGGYAVTFSVTANDSTSQTVLLETTGVATTAATMTLETFLAENALPVNTTILQQAEAARDAAILAQTNAETAETNAETAETNAETAETNAAGHEAGALAAKTAAELAALAAGAPIVTTLTDPVPANGTVELLKLDAGLQVYEVVTGAWVLRGWLVGPVFDTVALLLASTATTLGPTGQSVYAGGFRYEIVTTGENLTTAGGVKLYVPANALGTTSYKAFATPASNTLDNTASIQAAINDTGQAEIPPGQWRVDGVLELNQNDALRLAAGATLARTTDVASTDPVVWIKSNHASLRGMGSQSLIRSFNKSPNGVVLLGHESLSASHGNVLYCHVSGLALYGMQPFGQTSGDPDICLNLQNPQIGGKASYFHHINDMLLAHGNIGVMFNGIANANRLHDIEFLRLGGNDVGVENAAFYFNGGTENTITHWFVHFSPNIRTIYFTQGYKDAPLSPPSLNFITHGISEPDTGGTGTPQGVVVDNVGSVNTISYIGIGTPDDLTGTGWYGNNRRNSIFNGNNDIRGQNLEIRRPSAAIKLNSNDVNGGTMQLFTTGSFANPYFLFRGSSSTIPDTNLWEMFTNGPLRPADDNVRDLGGVANQVRKVYVGTEVLIDGEKVLGSQQSAITEPGAVTAYTAATISDPPTQTEVQAIANALATSVTELDDTRDQLAAALAALRAHGLIAT